MRDEKKAEGIAVWRVQMLSPLLQEGLDPAKARQIRARICEETGLSDPCSGEDKESLPSFEKRPYPYNICKRVTCRKITVVGQRPIRISKNEELFRDVEITIED